MQHNEKVFERACLALEEERWDSRGRNDLCEFSGGIFVTQEIRVGVVGAGVFGTYHARKAAGSDLAKLVGVSDADAERMRQVCEETGTQAFSDLSDLTASCEALIIATPAHTHAALVRTALEAGKHVLVEKPLALTGAEAIALAELAERKQLVLQIGHQERLVCQALGLFGLEMQIDRVELTRCGPPPTGGRAMDVSVIWDLMIHDIDLAHCLLGEAASDLVATGRRSLGAEFDAVDATFRIGSTQLSLKASRLEDAWERTLKIVCAEGVIEVDFIERSMVNTTGYALNETFADDLPDPLGAADAMFFAACLGQRKTMITGRSAAHAVATAEELETLAGLN